MRVSSEKRREQLIEAALVVAKREGVGGVSTRTVAAEAGATPGIVHYVFSSMEELLRAMISRMAEDYVVSVSELPPPEEADVTTLLEASFNHMWSDVEGDPEGHLLTFEVAAHALRNAGFDDLARWQYDTYRAVAARALEQVAEVCRIEWAVPVELLSRMVVVINDGVVLAWLVDRDAAKAREVYETFIGQFAKFAKPVD
ncbi:TetR/AcrR family transcriptional regulator [Mumia sp. Pv 4-285]|uniref:TetR/AcrR family transcriptional regulator n=1 Tax=Mumia qirimensis TaxID=3234852 RepID=UPI00351D0675